MTDPRFLFLSLYGFTTSVQYTYLPISCRWIVDVHDIPEVFKCLLLYGYTTSVQYICLPTCQQQAGELRRCITELGFAGVEIGSHVNDWNLDAKELEPFWTVCGLIPPPPL